MQAQVGNCETHIFGRALVLNVAADAYAQIWFGTVMSHSVVISEEPGCFLIGAATPTVSWASTSKSQHTY